MTAPLSGDIIEAVDIRELQPILARKPGDETVNNSAALQDDNDLTVALQANAVYAVDLYCCYSSGATPGMKTAFTRPTGATISPVVFICGGTGAAIQQGVSVAVDGAINGITGTGGDTGLQMHFTIATAGTAGDLRLRWAQNTANASNTILRAGSSMRVQRIS